MAIKDVQTAVVEANYDWTFIKVIAEEGTGYGECFFAPGLTALIRELKPSFWERIHETSTGFSAFSAPPGSKLDPKEGLFSTLWQGLKLPFGTY